MVDSSQSLPPADLGALGVESFEELHVLLAVAGSGEAGLTLEQLCGDLNLPEESVEAALSLFTGRGVFARRTDPARSYAIDHANIAVSTQVDRIQAEFTSNPLSLITRLNSLAVERVRHSAIRAFAGAFVLRDKYDG